MKNYHSDFGYLDNKNYYQDKTNNINNYYVFKSAFNDNEINFIKNLVKKYNSQKGTISNYVDLTYRSSNIKWLPYNNDTNWIYSKLNYLIDKANVECWNFDLFDKTEQIQYGEYDSKEGGHYEFHMDVSDNSINRKLSLSVQLSDENNYSGGDLQFFTNRKVRNATKEKGSVIIFPSYLMHRVKKVTGGKRESLVLWRHGPPLK